MLLTTASRAVPRTLRTHNVTVPRKAVISSVLRVSLRTSAKPLTSSGALSITLREPLKRSLLPYQSVRSAAAYQAASFAKSLSKEAEQAYGNETLAPHPDAQVSSDSSIHPVTGEVGLEEQEPDVDMMAGIRNDFKTILETFTLRDVPKEALYVGLAGVIPYLATSLSTVYLSFDIQYAAHHGQGFLMSGETAEALLHIIEPIQLGYGASIISFLGAIHWGLEWGGVGGHQGYPRYAIGIVATAVAWPTLLLSAEVGLIAQFLAFTFLYYADARASVRGWAPPWYATYRFVLTFIVGASIVASLIGRGQIADLITAPTGPADRMRALRDSQLEELEASDAEAKARAEAEAAAAEDEDDGEAEGEDDEEMEKE